MNFHAVGTGLKKRNPIMSDNLQAVIAGMDWKIYLVFCLFYFSALTNLRDFPVRNVPLIYLSYPLIIVLFGLNRLWHGFHNTFQLIAINTTYWFYLLALRFMVYGATAFELAYFAHILEPMMIISASGVAAKTSKGTRAAFGALVTILLLSTVAGNWIYFIGEPVKGWRITMQSSVGGDLVSGEYMRNSDKTAISDLNETRNCGLSFFSFHFSYQLALATIIVLVLILLRKFRMDIATIVLWISLFMLIIGVITNAERATLLSVPVGVGVYYLFAKKRITNLRIIIFGVITFFMIMYIRQHSENWIGETIFKRPINSGNENILTRVVIIPMAAVSTIFDAPMGAGHISNATAFLAVARKLHWRTLTGEVQAVHNHFASIILKTGIVGFGIIAWFFIVIGNNVKLSIKTSQENAGPELILGASCVALILHSFTHNAGFFESDPGILIVSSLLIASNYNLVRAMKRNKRAIPSGFGPDVGQGRPAIGHSARS